MAPRPCLDCGTLHRNPSGRCNRHQTATARGYNSQWQRTARDAIAAHRAVFGDWCPGWNRPAHPATDLTADHTVPKARGGSSQRSNVAVLCRSCNSAKKDS